MRLARQLLKLVDMVRLPPIALAAITAFCLVAAAPREARACGTGFSFFGSGGGGLWQRPAKEAPSFEPQTITLMGNEALGIPAGVEVDVWQPPAKQASVIEEILQVLRGHGIILEIDHAMLAVDAGN